MPRRKSSSSIFDLIFDLGRDLLSGLPFWAALPICFAAGILPPFIYLSTLENPELSGVESVFLLVFLGIGFFFGLCLLAGYISGIRRKRNSNHPKSSPKAPSKPRSKKREKFLFETPTPNDSPVDATCWSVFLLRELEWKRFEEVVVAFLNEIGLSANETSFGADGGIDFEVRDETTDRISMVGQCKAWPYRQVGVGPIRELFGVQKAGSIPEASFFTTGTYSEEAKKFAENNGIDVFDCERLLDEIQSLTPESSQRLLEIATVGDFRTPTCPQCGEKMVERQSGDRPSFWGCPKYPRCRGTLSKTN